MTNAQLEKLITAVRGGGGAAGAAAVVGPMGPCSLARGAGRGGRRAGRGGRGAGRGCHSTHSSVEAVCTRQYFTGIYTALKEYISNCTLVRETMAQYVKS